MAAMKSREEKAAKAMKGILKASPGASSIARPVGSGAPAQEVAGPGLPWATDDEIAAAVDMPVTLSSDEVAERLNTTRESVDKLRKDGRLLAIDSARHGIRYPIEQIGPNHAPLPGLAEVLQAFAGDAWAAWRFLAGNLNELEGVTGFNALRSGRVEELMDVLSARAYGSFS
jgi:hypothetical protein